MSPPTLFLRPAKTSSLSPSPLLLCKPFPGSANALDLSRASPAQILISLRFLVLSHLAELERRLSDFESPDLEAWKTKGEIKIDEARQWAKTAMEMLDGIRTDVRSQLPDVQFSDPASVDSFLRAYLPELPEMTLLSDVRSHLRDISGVRSHLPDIQDVRAHLPDFSDMRSKLDDVKSRFNDIDTSDLRSFVPVLITHMKRLHSHLSTLEVGIGGPSPFVQGSLLREFLDALSSTDLAVQVTEDEAKLVGEINEKVTRDVVAAVNNSLEGTRLITYDDLPQPWKNNPYVKQGYRFIPLERWSLIIKSIIELHNETLNIHTHLIPFVLYSITLLSTIWNPTRFEPAEVFFMSFACSMETCARIDYVGIGWLISASVATVANYGYQCHPQVGHAFIGICLAMGVLGNILPFMEWFNQYEYRYHRMAFFLALAFSGLAPLAGIAILHSHEEMMAFAAPLFPSFASYLLGFAFYATRWPESHLPPKVQHYLDHYGGGSHAIWHCFIVLAITQHQQGMQFMRNGIQCLADYTSL
ncbi:hypothetical protein Agabi119p4_1580 [Agaricus bisporus var. burnettii]|uniref:HlyIII-domain-containing protein n=1 Tax=Agaricus bisporus var. burnettii TaxID=192524 RepID=A0A8H7KJ55_AGABI|nr:hypothetical protein Agabi119p4_1580 [Agaricus bisporus var. burnettii]